jgi:hypothetical protein
MDPVEEVAPFIASQNRMKYNKKSRQLSAISLWYTATTNGKRLVVS